MTGRHRSDAEPGSVRPDAAPVEFSVLAGDPTAEELAAVTAVLTTLAGETETAARLEQTPAPSAWRSSRAVVRQPIAPGAGAWRSFSG